VTEPAAAFCSPLNVEVLDDGDHYRLTTPLIFRSAELRQTVVAPTGFVTDFASTPAGTHNMFPKAGPWSRPAVIHDAAYQMELTDIGAHPLLLTKVQADRLFLEGMTAIGVPAWKRWLMYQAVRWFGKGKFIEKRSEAV